MSELEVTTGFFSLAELAQMDTTEIVAIQSRMPNAGVYTVIGEEARMVQLDPREGREDQAPLIQLKFKFRPIDAILVDKSIDVPALIASDRRLNEAYTFWPNDLKDCVALLKGRYELIGLPNDGLMGGVEGLEPGWVDGIVGHQFNIRVDIKEGKNGAFARYTFLRPEAAE